MELKTAIILAGGFGTRLQSVVADVPKPMAPINNIPFLTYQLRFLKYYGFENIILSVGYLHEKISDFYKDEFEGLKLSYVIENEPLGTGGGIRKGIEQSKDETVLALNGDSFFDMNMNLFQGMHEARRSKFSLALRRVNNASRYGKIEIKGDQRISSFREKSITSEAGLINAGVYILDKKLFLEQTSANKKFSIEKDLFEKELKALPIYGFEFEGYFIDIGIPEDYAKAQHEFKELKYN